MCHSPPRRQRGFSLLELIVVMAILTVLAGASLPLVNKGVARARTMDTQRELNSLEIALTAYFEDTLRFPVSFEELERNVLDTPGWAGPYLRAGGSGHVGANISLVRDAWDQPYHVRVRNDVELTISSRGLDGDLGTDDDISLVLDVTPVLRSQTRDELALLNQAVTAYNAEALPDHPLPQDIHELLDTLAGAQLLPRGLAGLADDAWGDPYRPEPPGQDPVVILASRNLPRAAP